MSVIHKYEVPSYPSEIDIAMPMGAKVLTAQVQGLQVVLWAIVDTSRTPEVRRFRIVYTGQESPLGAGRYVATVQFSPPNALVVHVFEVTP